MFQVRSSDDPGDLGTWSGDITSPGSLGGDLDRYVQYRVLMETTHPGSSPVLEDITFRADQSGIDTDVVDLSEPRLSAEPNPFNPYVSISFGLETAGMVRLSAFDVRGRMVRRIADAYLQAGEHRLGWDGTDDSGRPLAAGIYWLRLERAHDGAAPCDADTRQVVLLR